MRTPLTYYGGKQLLAPQIVSLMPPHRVYLEAFTGGAAVLFAKPRAERETLNDLDGAVMRFWRALRERPDELAAAVAATPYSRAEWRASRDHDTDDDVEAARRLLVEVDQSFSRSRESWSNPCIGDGRGRWQPGSWANLPPKLLAAATRLRGVALEHEDALTLIPRWDRSDAVIYVDPPYTGPLRTERTKRYRVDDDGSLWPCLIDVLLQVKHAAVILSGYPCEEADRLGWRTVRLERKRTVQARAGGGASVRAGDAVAQPSRRYAAALLVQRGCVVRLIPTSIAEANRYVAHHHRHLRPARGALFALGAENDGQVVGVAIVGRPVARALQDGLTVEVTRLCTDGTRSAPSFLLGRCRRAAAALGYERVLTYTIPEEGGASLRAAGLEQTGLLAARSWAESSVQRERVDRSTPRPRARWEAAA